MCEYFDAAQGHNLRVEAQFAITSSKPAAISRLRPDTAHGFRPASPIALARYHSESAMQRPDRLAPSQALRLDLRSERASRQDGRMTAQGAEIRA